MAFGSALVLLAVVSIYCRLTSYHTGTAPLPLSITIPSSSSPLPLAISLCAIRYHSVSLFWWTMGVVVAMYPLFSSSLHITGLLFRGAWVVVVSLSSITAVASLPSPLCHLATICVLISVPAVMGVVPPSPAVVPALSVPVPVPVMLPGVPVPGLLPPPFRGSAGFVAVCGLNHKRPVQVCLHVRMQVEGGCHSAALFWVEFIEQSFTACPHVVSPQLVGPLLPNGHGLCRPLLLLTAHRDQTRKQSCHTECELSDFFLYSLLDEVK